MRRKQNSSPTVSANLLTTFLDVSHWLGQLFYLSVEPKPAPKKRSSKKQCSNREAIPNQKARLRQKSQRKRFLRVSSSQDTE